MDYIDEGEVMDGWTSAWTNGQRELGTFDTEAEGDSFNSLISKRIW